MFGYFIAAIPLFLGFFWVLFDKRRRGWHDRIAGTYVVYNWPAEADATFISANVARELAEDLESAARKRGDRADV